MSNVLNHFKPPVSGSTDNVLAVEGTSKYDGTEFTSEEVKDALIDGNDPALTNILETNDLDMMNLGGVGPISQNGITILDTTSGGFAATLTVPLAGSRKILQSNGTAVITVTGADGAEFRDDAAAHTVLTFDAAGDEVELVRMGVSATQWWIVHNVGVVVS